MKGNPLIYKSVFAHKLNSFVEEKQSLGYSFRSTAKILRAFDNAMLTNDIKSDILSEETATLWTAARDGEAKSNQICRITAMRSFASFLLQRGECVYMCPYPNQKNTTIYHPHIYTKDEISRIFKVADDMRYDWRSPSLHLTTPIIIKTLYSTGMRISEVLSLKRKDVDLAHKCIMARDTKGGKERLLPMASSLAEVYKDYCETTKYPTDDFLFKSRTGTIITHTTFYHTFRRLLEKADIPYLGRGKGPRIHDVRHTMAVHRLNQWSAENKDITAMLPILAVYLGHENVRMVSYYLRLTAQVYPELTAQVERDFGEVIPDIISKEWEALKDYD